MRALQFFFTLFFLAGPTTALAQDADGDGVSAPADCDDNDPNNFPGNTEVCDGQDNDCNGVADFGAGGGGPADVWVSDTGSSINSYNYTKGNVLRADSAVTVTEWGMPLDVASGSVVLTISEAASSNGPFTVVDQVDLGAVSPGIQTHTASGLSVALSPGMYYAFVASWTGSAEHWYDTSLTASPSWGTNMHGAWSSTSVPPATPWTPDNTPSGTYDMEIVTGSVGETWSAVGGSVINSLDYTKGNILQASSAATVTEWGMPLDIASGQLILTVSEGASTNGPFTVVDQVNLGTVAPGFQTHLASGRSIALSPGMYYAFMASWTGDAGHYYGAAPPNPTWGTFQTGAWNSTSAAPVSPWNPQSLPGSAYDMEITTGGGGPVGPATEIDADNDGYYACADDCDDNDPTRNPGSLELCDGVDNDCNGSADFDLAGEVDADNDGFLSCDDCDDSTFTVFPGALELCDGLDNDCNGVADADVAGEIDADSDGYLSCDDCDDLNPAVSPGAAELCDGIDNDCNGSADVNGPNSEDDADLDGYLACEDCDDSSDLVNPDATEICDGLDNDCDGVPFGGPGGELDADSDGFLACEDCNDQEPTVNPDAVEVCDGLDNDCDGTDPATELDDLDGDGLTVCDGDCDDNNADIQPGAFELCDGLDNNCDGTVDEGVECDAAGDTGTSAVTDKGSCGCSTGPGPSAAWVVGLVLLAIRRRETSGRNR